MSGYKFDYENKIWGGEVLRLNPVHFRALRLKYALEVLKDVRGKVLDAGCGAGDFCEAIKYYRPDLELHGIDISKKAIDAGKKRGLQSAFKVCNAQDLPFNDNYFDAIVCFDLIEHVEFPEKVLSEIYRVLKPGGFFHAHIPIENNLVSFEGMLIKLGWKGKEIYGGHPHHFTLKEVKNMLKKAKFKIIKYKYGDHLFHQVWEIAYFTMLLIKGKNVEHTVEGFLSLSKPNLWFIYLKLIKNILAVISNTESRIFWWLPGISLHVTCHTPVKIHEK